MMAGAAATAGASAPAAAKGTSIRCKAVVYGLPCMLRGVGCNEMLRVHVGVIRS